jgi:hypothetical protein
MTIARGQVDTLFGRVTIRQPRWRPCGCDRPRSQQKTDQTCRESRTSALIGGRAAPELVRVQAELGARLSFREAARVMRVLLPSSKATNHTGVRRRLARTADRLQSLDDASRIGWAALNVARWWCHSTVRTYGQYPASRCAILRSRLARGNGARSSPTLRRRTERAGNQAGHDRQRPAGTRVAAGATSLFSAMVTPRLSKASVRQWATT